VKRKKELPFGSMLAFVVKVINLVNNTNLNLVKLLMTKMHYVKLQQNMLKISNVTRKRYSSLVSHRHENIDVSMVLQM
jgi:hypothetical protein